MRILLQKKRSDPSADQRRGGVLALSLITVMVVAVLAGGYMAMSSAVTQRQGLAVDTKQAFYMAEAGLAEAFAGMMIAKSGNVGSKEEPAKFGHGCFWVEAEDAEPNLVELSSTGLYGGGRATLSLVVEKGGQSVAALGIFSQNALTVPDGVELDGYDSSLGPYVPPGETSGPPLGLLEEEEPPPPVEVGSNAGVTVSGLTLPAEIQGSVVPGQGSSVTLLGTPLITGSTTPRVLNPSLPWVVAPVVTMGAGVTHASGTPLPLAPGTYGISYLQVMPNAEVIVQGPATIVVGSVTLQNLAEIQFDTTLGPIDLYVTGSLTFGAGSLVSMTSEDPSQVTIQLPNQTTGTLHAASEFFGAIYAPKATINVGSTFELYGSLIAKQLELQPGVTLHFDHHLAVLGAKSTLPTLFNWRIVDFEPLGPEADPFLVLGVSEDTLPLPAEAHEDQLLEITYHDDSSELQSYAGMESDFDWSDVTSVEDCERDNEETALMTDEGRELLEAEENAGP